MARIVILGAGVAGHTAAAFARKWLGRDHNVVVISPKPKYNWVPSNVWVGVGIMAPEAVTFDLAPVYQKVGIEFHQARAVALHPEGRSPDNAPFVAIEYTESGKEGTRAEIPYDFLVNATGPQLKFEATAGLGPYDGHSLSVCTHRHAAEASAQLDELVERMQRGEHKTFLVGTGHGDCTCQGAAFEYIVNLEFALRRRGVRDRAQIKWISNEYRLGDFGMGGMHIRHAGYITPSSVFTESVYAERDLDWITQAHVAKVEEDRIYYETLTGEVHEQPFDFAMLLPPFAGVGLQAFDRDGADITSKVFAPNGFMKVDADYTPRPYEEWKARDWPRTYQNPEYSNLFAAGIAFAPPHPISRPRKSPHGTPIAPTAPRTGMPSAMIGKAVTQNIVEMIKKGTDKPTHTASMAELGAACVASAGAAWFSGTAASMTVYPIVPDFETYPEFGRDMRHTFGEIGLAGHWIKYILHWMFLYKAKLHPLWSLVPE
jgi:sulfide:quinone oxidoreductase